MTSLSFDPFINLYNETRTFDRVCFDNAMDYLSSILPQDKYPSCFEPGIGNGRIAKHFENRGYSVFGIDISYRMLNDFNKSNRRINIALADSTAIPFQNGEFDFSIVVHLFYFIKNWKKVVDELLRVTKPHGKIIIMHTGTGQEIPELNQNYKDKCLQLGHTIENLGVKSTTDVVNYLVLSGFSVERISERWKWVENIRIGKAIEHIQRRAYSFTGETPHKIHEEVIQLLVNESMQRYGELNAIIPVPNQIQLVVIQK